MSSSFMNILKKVLSLFLVLALFSNCNKKECEPTPVANTYYGEIQGNWTLNSIDQVNGEYYKDGKVIGTFCMNGTDVTGNYMLGDSQELSSVVSYTSTLTTTNNDGEMNSVTNTITDSKFEGTYSFNKSARLLITYDSANDISTPINVITLTDNNLILESPIVQQLNDLTLSSTLRVSLNR